MREIAPFGLRLTPKLKARLEEEAAEHGRSLQKEVVRRLEMSLQEPLRGAPEQTLGTPLIAGQTVPAYDLRLNDPEKEMLRLFQSWPAEKQLAFLTLFK